MAGKAEKDAHAAEFGNKGESDEKERALSESLERKASMVKSTRLAEELYLAVRVAYCLNNMTWRLGAVLVCSVASFGPELKYFEMPKLIGVYEMKARGQNPEDGYQIGRGREVGEIE